MKVLTTALLATAFIASPAMACSWMKSADKSSSYTASVETEKKMEEAMTTFDPAKPVFEEETEVTTEEVIEEEAAE